MTKLTNKWKNKDNKDKDNNNDKDTSIQSNENNVFKKRH